MKYAAQWPNIMLPAARDLHDAARERPVARGQGCDIDKQRGKTSIPRNMQM